MSTESLWIDDGLTFDAVLTPVIVPKTSETPEVLGRPLAFSHRPPLSDAVLDYDEAQSLPGKERIQSLYTFILPHLKKWDFKKPSGEIAPLTQESLNHLPIEYLFDMRNKIMDSVKVFAGVAKN